MKKALVIPAKGVGDALIMMIASHRLLREGYHVTTCHPFLGELAEWFPGQHFIKQLPLSLSSFDLILIENDHSKAMHVWKERFPQSVILYPGYSASKNPPLGQGDHVFNPTLSMAENVALAVSADCTSNGIVPLSHLEHRRFPKRILIHPTSSSTDKNWHARSFIKLHRALQKKGYDPIFVMSPTELKLWEGEKKHVATFPSLSELAAFVYESGAIIGNDSLMGHLGSNLQLPTLIIANDRERMQLWRPGWHLGEVLTPEAWVPNCKGMRLRQKKWKYFISLKRVLSTFEKLVQPPTPSSLP